MRRSLAVLALADALPVAALPVAASSQTIAPFDLGRSPIALSGDARPGQYVITWDDSLWSSLKSPPTRKGKSLMRVADWRNAGDSPRLVQGRKPTVVPRR